MKKNWQTKKLSEVCTVFADGDWIEKKDQSTQGIRLIQTGNIGEGVFKDKENKSRYISEETFRKLHCFQIVEGDCLVSRLPDPIGRACLVPKSGNKMITAVDCTIIRFKPGIIDSQFFIYYSLSEEYLSNVEQESRGTTRKRISRKSLGNIEIPIPPLNIQHRIVKILDESFEHIAKVKENTEKNFYNVKDLFESYLSEIFTSYSNNWKQAELGTHVKFIDYRGKTPKKTSSGVRLITAKNIKMGYIQIRPEEFIASKDYATWMTRGIPNKGDVLITTEAPLGNIAQLDIDEKVAFAQRTIILQPDSNIISNTFLKYLLMSKPIQKKILDNGTGATVKGIKASLLKKLTITYPSIAEQYAITEKLDALSEQTSKLENNYKQKLVYLDELKQSILHQAFTGQL